MGFRSRGETTAPTPLAGMAMAKTAATVSPSPLMLRGQPGRVAPLPCSLSPGRFAMTSLRVRPNTRVAPVSWAGSINRLEAIRREGTGSNGPARTAQASRTVVYPVLMLLSMSRGLRDQERVELPSHVALDAADRLPLGEALLGPAFHVVAGGGV